MTREGGEGWGPWELIPRVAGGAVSVPVVVGFVALGAAVLVGRSVRGVIRESWALVPSWRSSPHERGQPDRDSDSHAA